MGDLKTYTGSCHCGVVRFSFNCPEITEGRRCNCSICIRKGAIMSVPYFSPGQFNFVEGLDALTNYQWGDKDVNHWFCKYCGIYPFHDGPARPGYYRVNLGCVNELDPLALNIELIDGQSY